MIFKNKIKEIEKEIAELNFYYDEEISKETEERNKEWKENPRNLYFELKSNLKLLKELQRDSNENFILEKDKGEDYIQAEKRNNYFKEQGRQEVLEKVKDKINERVKLVIKLYPHKHGEELVGEIVEDLLKSMEEI